MAFGGAGIYMSRALMEKMNAPGACKFFEYGIRMSKLTSVDLMM